MIGERIRKRRLELKLSQDELAKRLGYSSRSTINKIEKGVNDITQSKLLEFSNVLNCKPSYLLGIDEEPKKETNLHDVNKDDNLGNVITQIRNKYNLTYEEIAKEFNVSIKDLKQYEKGTKPIPFELLEKLGEYFNIDMKLLTGLNYEYKSNDNMFNTSLNILKMTKRWNEEVGVIGFSDEELDELISYAKYLISKRKDKN